MKKWLADSLCVVTALGSVYQNSDSSARRSLLSWSKMKRKNCRDLLVGIAVASRDDETEYVPEDRQPLL
jgi:hypothetical protein